MTQKELDTLRTQFDALAQKASNAAARKRLITFEDAEDDLAQIDLEPLNGCVGIYHDKDNKSYPCVCRNAVANIITQELGNNSFTRKFRLSAECLVDLTDARTKGRKDMQAVLMTGIVNAITPYERVTAWFEPLTDEVLAANKAAKKETK